MKMHQNDVVIQIRVLDQVVALWALLMSHMNQKNHDPESPWDAYNDLEYDFDGVVEIALLGDFSEFGKLESKPRVQSEESDSPRRSTNIFIGNRITYLMIFLAKQL